MTNSDGGTKKVTTTTLTAFHLNDLDQTTSTTNLSQEKKQRTPLKPVATTLLEGTDKNNLIRNKSYSSFGNLKESIRRSMTT